jgi:glycosyltransferase involved in cell wall biosynthesis
MKPRSKEPTVAVIWVDWGDYHIARFRAVRRSGSAVGIELVGGAGWDPNFPFRSDQRDGLPITTVLPGIGWHEAGQRRLAAALWRTLSRLRPDVLLIPGYYHAADIAAIVWGRLHRKTNVLMSESTYEDHARSPIREYCKRILVQCLFDWAIVGGKRTRHYMQTLGVPDSKLAMFHNVVDNEFFGAGTAALRANKSPADLGFPAPYFLFVGRVAPEKNLERLLESFAKYRRQGGSWSLVMVGDGPLKAALQARAKSIPEAHFAGFQRGSALLAYYAFAGCFVLPSIREPWGLVVNEAMAAGLPVIVSHRCGCADDLVEHAANGFLFEPEDADALARCMHQITDMPGSALAGMGSRSREIIRRYSPESFASEVWRIACAGPPLSEAPGAAF